MKNLALRLIVIFVAVATLGGIAAAPAHAAFTDEPDGLFTICDNNACDNSYAKLSYNIDFRTNGVCIEVASWMDNMTSGIVNRAPGTRVTIYRLHGCSDELDIPQADNDLDCGDILSIQAGAYINNKTSSFRVWND